MKYVALVPSYEPDENLIKVVKELYDNDFFVVLVNDGSSKEYDKYFLECENYSNYLKYDSNRGKGYALKYGFKFIQKEYPNSVIVTVDSDGQHRVKDAIKLCKIAEKKDNTIVLGKRLREENIPLRSKFGNSLTRFIFRIATKKDIYDTQTGLRAFKSDLLPFMLSIKGNRFEYEMDVLLYSRNNNIDLVEEIIKTIYIDKNSNSHFNPIKDSMRIYRRIFIYKKKSLLIMLVMILMIISLIVYFT